MFTMVIISGAHIHYLSQTLYDVFDVSRMCVFAIGFMIEEIEFFLNVFTEFSEFSDNNKVILKRLLDSNPLSPVRETGTLSLCHRHSSQKRQLN